MVTFTDTIQFVYKGTRSSFFGQIKLFSAETVHQILFFCFQFPHQAFAHIILAFDQAVSLIFQLEFFLINHYQYTKFIDGFVKNIIRQLTNQKICNSKLFNPKFFEINQNTQRGQRARSRANSVEIPFYFLNWAISKSIFKTAMTKFKAVTKNVHIEEDDRFSTGNTFTNFFFRLPVTSADDPVKTFTIFNLSDVSFQKKITSELSKKLFRKMYPPRDDKLSFFLGPHLSTDMFNINEDIIRKIIVQIFAEIQREPGLLRPQS